MTDDPKRDDAPFVPPAGDDAGTPASGEALPAGHLVVDPRPASGDGSAASPATPSGDAKVQDPMRLTPAWARFRSCRWRSDPEDGEFCTHRDVLPYAGKEGFNPESWCPDCPYFKLKRVARKPSY
ncbi:MAG: hypothetical protein M3Q55_10890 [Acidobacteriota bacterium]|nr:hypothetical protein [Acidobacteriota bacterium]